MIKCKVFVSKKDPEKDVTKWLENRDERSFYIEKVIQSQSCSDEIGVVLVITIFYTEKL